MLNFIYFLIMGFTRILFSYLTPQLSSSSLSWVSYPFLIALALNLLIFI